jgi:sulfoxide reductase catalytic subunit YedY
MLIKKKSAWEISEREAAPEDVYLGRRRFLGVLGAGGVYSIGAGLTGGLAASLFSSGTAEGAGGGPAGRGPYPASRNPEYTLDRPMTDETAAARYNNFYEFSPFKSVWRNVEDMVISPWTVKVSGLVEAPRTFDVDSLAKEFPLEERLYRHRCVEAWAMAVPWTGFPLSALMKKVRPLSSARFVRFTSLLDRGRSFYQKIRPDLPWPYEEGLTIAEASNELAFIATGIYGHALPRQHGAPIRLVVPWKYGFKSIKSIVSIEFTDGQPRTFWNTLSPDEYGFRANVDPHVPHPRWSQETERMLGTDEVRETVKYNGYARYVKAMYE